MAELSHNSKKTIFMSYNLKPITDKGHINLLLEVIEKNEHIIEASAGKKTVKKLYAFNSHVVIAQDVNFLEAIRKDMGGELIFSKNIGPFLYFDVN